MQRVEHVPCINKYDGATASRPVKRKLNVPSPQPRGHRLTDLRTVSWHLSRYTALMTISCILDFAAGPS
jgi:hypothetical protein